jgi:hypothetical protein
MNLEKRKKLMWLKSELSNKAGDTNHTAVDNKADGSNNTVVNNEESDHTCFKEHLFKHQLQVQRHARL